MPNVSFSDAELELVKGLLDSHERAHRLRADYWALIKTNMLGYAAPSKAQLEIGAEADKIVPVLSAVADLAASARKKL